MQQLNLVFKFVVTEQEIVLKIKNKVKSLLFYLACGEFISFWDYIANIRNFIRKYNKSNFTTYT